jgi:hypothetical protein
MELGELVHKYNVSVQVGGYGVKWTLALETSSGQRHQLTLSNGTDVQNALHLVRGDKSLYYDAKSQTLSTGWNDPGA